MRVSRLSRAFVCPAQEVDFALGKFTINADRASVVEYTVPFWQEASRIAMRRRREHHMFVYVRPFQYRVWLCVLLAVPVGAVAMAAVYCAERRLVGGGGETPIFWTTFGQTIWFTFTSLFSQGLSTTLMNLHDLHSVESA